MQINYQEILEEVKDPKIDLSLLKQHLEHKYLISEEQAYQLIMGALNENLSNNK